MSPQEMSLTWLLGLWPVLSFSWGHAATHKETQKLYVQELFSMCHQEPEEYSWDWILRVLDQNIRLDKREFVELWALSWNTGLNKPSRTPGIGANSLLR